MTRTRHYLNAFLIILIACLVYNNALAATFYIKQPGQFQQCKSAAGSYKYVCIEGTGCAPNTLKCLSTTPPATCPAFTTGTPPSCVTIPCGQGFTGNQPNCTPIIVPPPPVGGGQTGFMPSVDISKNMQPVVGYSDLRIQATNEQANAGGDEGAFRIECAVSHMSNDDPIVYPNQKAQPIIIRSLVTLQPTIKPMLRHLVQQAIVPAMAV